MGLKRVYRHISVPCNFWVYELTVLPLPMADFTCSFILTGLVVLYRAVPELNTREAATEDMGQR